MTHFPLLYRLNGIDSYLIWNSNDIDTVEADATGHILTFHNSSALATYAAAKHYTLESEEPILHDLDWVATWLSSQAMPVDCSHALAAWNLFGDVARSIAATNTTFELLGKQLLDVYNKLFWGNNLPAMTPEGCHYDPEWSPEELSSLAALLSAGLAMFQSHLLAV